MAYQSFDNEKGDSDSSAKLACLNLPEDLTGKTLLDIGCNEGFFVQEALRRGAKKAVGIDISHDLITKAKLRTPNGRFEVMSWWDLGSEKFDYILFLSAIHYERDQRRLLTKLSFNLEEGGTLILECGVVLDDSSQWKLVQRHDGVFRFPTLGYLENTLLDGYTSRFIGPSVTQSGDPLGRYVIHCNVVQPVVHVVYGWSGSGKTGYSQIFKRQGIRVVSTDVIMSAVAQNLKGSNDPFISYLSQNLHLGDIDRFCKKMVADGRGNQFAKFVMRFISRDDEVTIIEGFPFMIPHVRALFEIAVRDGGFRYSETCLSGGTPSDI